MSQACPISDSFEIDESRLCVSRGFGSDVADPAISLILHQIRQTAGSSSGVALESRKRILEEPSEIETKMSFVDGAQNRLFYRGIDVCSLTEHSSYEEVAYLLLIGLLPNRKQLDEFKRRIAASRRIPAGTVTLIGSLPRSALPMDVLRTAISAMAMFDPKPRENCREALLDVAIELITQAPTIVTAHNHIRNSRLPIEPDPGLGHAANFLYMLKGTKPDEYETKVLDTCWVLHADHGLNPSTFAARVTASAQSDIYAALTTAIGTLKGTIHGGANQKVMEMLLEIRDDEKVGEYVKNSLREGKKIPGFGHRIYKGEDPRVACLRSLSESLCERTKNTHWFELSRKLEETVSQERDLHPNMDFYSATLYYALGIPVDMLTTMFACSRMAGWTGHIIEQYELNRLIRPLGDYVGDLNVEYVPIEKRR
jgi:citrate synthase